MVLSGGVSQGHGGILSGHSYVTCDLYVAGVGVVHLRNEIGFPANNRDPQPHDIALQTRLIWFRCQRCDLSKEE